MDLTARQQILLNWVKSMHGEQKRKYTGEPYWRHCYAVGKHANEYNIYLGAEIGFCHDLIEDTECELPDLLGFLLNSGYSKKESFFITQCVSDLTDEYTKEEYPTLNRKERKLLEAERLGNAHPDAQSVKYCDLINNTKSICEHDPRFSKVYLKEKENILNLMNKGNKELLSLCISFNG